MKYKILKYCENLEKINTEVMRNITKPLLMCIVDNCRRQKEKLENQGTIFEEDQRKSKNDKIKKNRKILPVKLYNLQDFIAVIRSNNYQ